MQVILSNSNTHDKLLTLYLWYLKEKYSYVLKIQNGIANSIIVKLPRAGNILYN